MKLQLSTLLLLLLPPLTLTLALPAPFQPHLITLGKRQCLVYPDGRQVCGSSESTECTTCAPSPQPQVTKPVVQVAPPPQPLKTKPAVQVAPPPQPFKTKPASIPAKVPATPIAAPSPTSGFSPDLGGPPTPIPTPEPDRLGELNTPIAVPSSSATPTRPHRPPPYMVDPSLPTGWDGLALSAEEEGMILAGVRGRPPVGMGKGE
ncbi:hypothetical protein EJ06DRAFT_306870 [Trichodelitschia bisporula]|uniref:Uncharacterized protein n=1 Tax=Trichodelitschia bisporula TaxID=703511 RepID=A0A6G1I341_9PEZI|nr:hypothetical protein EJ06DRAFT_306870 [Trichodelitschia bisporula]